MMNDRLMKKGMIFWVGALLAIVLPGTLRAESSQFKERATTLYKDVFDQNVYYEGVNQLDFGRWGRKLLDREIPAANVNIFDEVPDSAFFTNRHARERLSAEELEKGYSETEGPDLSTPMMVTKGKQEGLHPGFFIRDARGDAYCLKFDAEGYLELATAAEVIASRFYHAIGYNVPQYTMFRFRAEDIVVGENAYTYDDTGFRKKMTTDLLDQYLSFLPITEEGEYLASASKIVPGRNAGHFSFHSRRKEDPEDAVNHRDRREIRALSVFSMWLNNYDVRESNALDMEVVENGKPVLKHYLIDFNSALGAAHGGPKPPMFGHEHMIDYGESAKAFFSLGLWEKPWQEKWRIANEQPHESPAVGYFSNEGFDPESHKVQLPYETFRVLTKADGFWAAKIMMSFTDEDVRAMVKAGQYSREEDEDYITKTLIERRDMIGRYWFSQTTPLDQFELSGNVLRFRDLALHYGWGDPDAIDYTAEVFSGSQRRKPSEILTSQEPVFSLNPQCMSSNQTIEVRIRVSRRGDEDPNPYIKIILDEGGVRQIRHED